VQDIDYRDSNAIKKFYTAPQAGQAAQCIASALPGSISPPGKPALLKFAKR
jgi:hypothetical protein